MTHIRCSLYKRPVICRWIGLWVQVSNVIPVAVSLECSRKAALRIMTTYRYWVFWAFQKSRRGKSQNNARNHLFRYDFKQLHRVVRAVLYLLIDIVSHDIVVTEIRHHVWNFTCITSWFVYFHPRLSLTILCGWNWLRWNLTVLCVGNWSFGMMCPPAPGYDSTA